MFNKYFSISRTLPFVIKNIEDSYLCSQQVRTLAFCAWLCVGTQLCESYAYLTDLSVNYELSDYMVSRRVTRPENSKDTNVNACGVSMRSIQTGTS